MNLRRRLPVIGAAAAAYAVAATAAPQPLTKVEHSDYPRIVVKQEPASALRRTPDLLDFNMNVNGFQKQFISPSSGSINPWINYYLKPFAHAMYRYPGGMQANTFNWKWAMGAVDARPKQKLLPHSPPLRIRFGPAEYLHFLGPLQGQPLLVLNLVGWDKHVFKTELPGGLVAASQGAFAKYLDGKYMDHQWRHLYELGNELDRGAHNWTAEKYIERARAVMQAVRANDPKATFIVPVREFNHRYHGKLAWRGVSKGDQFSKKVLNGLGTVNNVSVHDYYDSTVPVMRKISRVPVRIGAIQRLLHVLNRARSTPLHLWVTEHARGRNPKYRWQTSNLQAAISTGDFLSALMQVQGVEGAFWHQLNGTYWQLFEPRGPDMKPKPRPIYWAFRVLNKAQFGYVLPTRNFSPNKSDYDGGYDTRGVAFLGNGGSKLGLWVVNRRRQRVPIRIVDRAFANCAGTLRHFYVKGPHGADPDKAGVKVTVDLSGADQPVTFNGDGYTTLTLPPSSVSSYVITFNPSTSCSA